MMREIPLTQGKVALVDDEDFEALNAFKWFALRHRNTFYAKRQLPRCGGRQRGEHMHRVVLSRKIGRPLLRSEEADHENGDGLDNRRENLRPTTGGQNGRNCCRRASNPSSQYLGVSWHKNNRRWQAKIQVNRKAIHLGQYSKELEAALARERFIADHPELMARSNFKPKGHSA